MNTSKYPKYLFIASTGGHLTQLIRLAKSIAHHPDSTWITFRSPQSESLLQDRNVLYVKYVKARDIIGSLRAYAAIINHLARNKYDHAISTGAALAVPAFMAARTHSVSCTYVESISRLNGPSLTGRIVANLKLADTYTQHTQWSNTKWRPYPSVLGSFKAIKKHQRNDGTSLRLFVTLGTIRPYRFDSLVDSILRNALATDTTIWQLGETGRENLPGTVHNYMPATEFQNAARNADVVITHAGVGSILQFLEWGIHPVVIPRRRARNEHVDDHQHQIADYLRQKGLAKVVEPGNLDKEVILEAFKWRTE